VFFSYFINGTVNKHYNELHCGDFSGVGPLKSNNKNICSKKRRLEWNSFH